ncbi:hypothetical protein JCM10450v2_003653 [Rhodotorula kratochvilovae]
MARQIRLKSWFASVAPAAHSTALAVWLYGLPDSDSGSASPVALQLVERLAKDRVRSELRGEQLEVQLVGGLDTERADAAGVLEVYQKSFAAGITEHLEFLLVAARTSPPHTPDLRAAFPPPAPRDPLQAALNGSDRLPPSLFDLGTGYSAPKSVPKSRRELTEELKRAKLRRAEGKARADGEGAKKRAPYTDRDDGYEEQDEEGCGEEEDVEMREAEAAAPADSVEVDPLESAGALELEPLGAPGAPAPSAVAPPAPEVSPSAPPAASPFIPHPASAPNYAIHAPLSAVPTPPHPRSTATATGTPARAPKPPSRIAASVFSFFRASSTRSSTPRPQGAQDAVGALEDALARALAEQLAREQAKGVKVPLSERAKEAEARPTGMLAATAPLGVAQEGEVAPDEPRETADEPEQEVDEPARQVGEASAERRGNGEQEVAENGVQEGESAGPPPADTLSTCEDGEGEVDVEMHDVATVETSVAIEVEEVEEVELEKVEQVGGDQAVSPHGNAEPVINGPLPLDGDGLLEPASPVRNGTAHARLSPTPHHSPLLSSSRQSSPADAFPASSGGISSLFHASSDDEDDGADTSADLTAQAISEFVERDLASSIVDEDEYVAERLRPTAPRAAAAPKPAAPVEQRTASAGEASPPRATAVVPPSSSREPTPQPAASSHGLAKEDSAAQAEQPSSSPPEWREPDFSSFDAPGEAGQADEVEDPPERARDGMEDLLVREMTNGEVVREEDVLQEEREEVLEPLSGADVEPRDYGEAAALGPAAPTSEDVDMRDSPAPAPAPQPAEASDERGIASPAGLCHAQSPPVQSPERVILPTPSIAGDGAELAASAQTPDQAASSMSPVPAEAEREHLLSSSGELHAAFPEDADSAEGSPAPGVNGGLQAVAVDDELVSAVAPSESPAQAERSASPVAATEVLEEPAAAEATLLSDDVVRETVEEVAETATKELVGSAVGAVVEPIAGPVVGDAVSELASDLAGGIVGEVVGEVVDAAAAVVDTLVQDEVSGAREASLPVQGEVSAAREASLSREATPPYEAGPSRAAAESSPPPQPEPEQRPLVQPPFEEPAWFPPEESKDWMDDDPFAAPVIKKDPAVRPKAKGKGKGKAREKDALSNGSRPRRSASSTAMSLLAPSPVRQSSPSFTHAGNATNGALAALAALRNEPTPAPDFYGSPAPSSDAPPQDPQYDVFGPVVSSQTRRIAAGPSSRTPRTRTASGAGRSSPALSSSPVSPATSVKRGPPNEAASPVKKNSPHKRSGFVFDCVEIPVAAKKRANPPAHPASVPLASTSTAFALVASTSYTPAVAAEPVQPSVQRSASPPPWSTTKPDPSSIFLDGSSGAAPVPPDGSSWLDAPAKTSRPSPKKYGSSSRVPQEQELPSDEEESDDPLASGSRRGSGVQGRKKVVRSEPEEEEESEDDDDEEVARSLLSPKGKGRASVPFEQSCEPVEYAGEDEGARDDAQHVDDFEDEEPVQHSASRSRSRARKRVIPSSSPPAAAPPHKKKPRRSTLPVAPDTVPPPRKPSLAGKTRPSLAGKAPRASLAPVTPAAPARAERNSGTPDSSARPSRVRKPATGWWDIQRGMEAAEASAAKKRARDEDEEPEQEAESRPAPPTKKAKVPRAAKRVVAAAAKERTPPLAESEPEPEPQEDFEDDPAIGENEPGQSPSPAPVQQPVPTSRAAPARKRKKRKSVVMPRYKNRNRASAASASQASPAPASQPVKKTAAASLSRASGVKVARKAAAAQEKVKGKARAVDVPEWAEGDEWAGLREVGIAREASEDGYTFSD